MYKVVRSEEVEPKMILGGPIKPPLNPQTVGSKRPRLAVGVFEPRESLVPHIHPESEEVY